MVTEIASFRDKIPLTFLFHGVDSPKARGVTGFWAGLELRVKVKAVVASWAPSLTEVAPASSSQSPQPCHLAPADLH